MKSVTINNRLYLFTNISNQLQYPVKIVDFNLQRLFTVKFDSEAMKPSVSRLNYSIAGYKHKAYLYGGIDQNSQILTSMDEFDATTYKFNQVKYRGEFKPKQGRQGHSAVAVDQYNMFIIGGTYSD